MDARLRQKISIRNPVHFLAIGFGSGLAPYMPGTFGTLAAVPLVWLCAAYLSFNQYLAITLITCIVGIWLCGKTAEDMQVHDDSSIVWDEIAGMMITMIAIPINLPNLLAGFLLFRFFDIVKPWPISLLDKHIHGGFGIMIDDILAGVLALICMLALLYLGF